MNFIIHFVYLHRYFTINDIGKFKDCHRLMILIGMQFEAVSADKFGAGDTLE